MEFLEKLPSPITPASRFFFAAWHRWCKGGKLPQRSNIDLRELGDLAHACLMLEICGRDDIRIGKVGRAITDHLGFDLTGFNYLDLTSKENRAWRAHLTLAQVAQPCGVVIYYWLRLASGTVMPVEFAGAPACEDGAETASLIVCCATSLTRIDEESPPVDPESYTEGEGMRFIDIGYGIPPLIPSQRQEPKPVQ